MISPVIHSQRGGAEGEYGVPIKGPGSWGGRVCIREDGGKPPPCGSPSSSSAVCNGGV